MREFLREAEAVDLIVGADLATQLDTGIEADELRELVDVGIVPRPGAAKRRCRRGWAGYEIPMDAGRSLEHLRTRSARALGGLTKCTFRASLFRSSRAPEARVVAMAVRLFDLTEPQSSRLEGLEAAPRRRRHSPHSTAATLWSVCCRSRFPSLAHWSCSGWPTE